MKGQELIKDLLHTLGGTDYRIIDSRSPEALSVIGNFESSFPMDPWGRVAWSRVSDPICRYWSSDAELMEAFVNIKEFVPDRPDVYVVWTNKLKPLLHIDFSDFENHTGVIFSADFDTWVIDSKRKWCIECFHEGELCFGLASKEI